MDGKVPVGALPWRVGRSVGRTVYDARGELIGTLDTPELAGRVVFAVNALAPTEPDTAWTSADPDDVVDGWLRLGAGYFLGDCFVEMYDSDALTVSHGEASVAADDSGRSFLPNKHTALMPLPVLRAILKQHGLAIIPAANVPSAAPDVCWHCLDCLEPSPPHCEHCPPLDECGDEDCQAEGCIARRAAKGKP